MVFFFKLNIIEDQLYFFLPFHIFLCQLCLITEMQVIFTVAIAMQETGSLSSGSMDIWGQETAVSFQAATPGGYEIPIVRGLFLVI